MNFKKVLANRKLNAIHASIHGKEDFIGLSEDIISNEQLKEHQGLTNRLTNHYKYSSVHASNLKDYTQNSMTVNGHLWDTHKGHSDYHGLDLKHHLKNMKEETSGLDKAIKSNSTPEVMTVHSSTVHDPRQLKNKEGIVHHPAYLSTSTYAPVANNRDINSKEDPSGDSHHHVLKIDVPKGHPGAYVNHITKYPGEYEFILPRGTNLKYHKTETKTTQFHNYYHEKKCNKHLHVHHMSIAE